MFVKSCHHDCLHLFKQSWSSHRSTPFDADFVYGISYIHGLDRDRSAYLHLYGWKFSVKNATIWHDVRQCRAERFHIHCNENISTFATIHRFGNVFDVVLCQLCTWHHLCNRCGGGDQRKRIEWSKRIDWDDIITQWIIHSRLRCENWRKIKMIFRCSSF